MKGIMIFRSGWAIGAFPLPLLIGLLMPLGAQAEHREANGMKTIEGTVWYRERMVLPPNAEIRVTLEDVARADAPSDRLSTTSLEAQGGPPFAFSLEYDPARLHDRGRYALRARIEANGRLLFTSTEHIPAFEREPGPVKILVSRVGGARVGGNPPAAKPDASLTDTYWKLVEMGGRAAAPGAGQRELNLVLSSEGARVQGFSGCNRFTGIYELSGDQVRFGQLASTRMACMEGMEQEQRFLDALARTTRLTLSGEDLELYAAEGQPILHFQAVYLK
jgi:putative lipoprotein